MKILMIAPEPFFSLRGTPISVFQRLHALSELGHEVDLVTYHLGEDVDIRGVRIHRTPRVGINRISPGPSGKKVLLDILLFWKISRLLLRKHYDVIHTHEEASFFSLFLPRLFRGRHLYDRHSSLSKQVARSWIARSLGVHLIFRFLERSVIRSCDALITIGDDLFSEANQLNPQLRNLLIENVPLQCHFPEADQETLARLKRRRNGNATVVYTGNLEGYQGLELLVASAELVVESLPHTLFVVLGGSPSQVRKWRRYVASRGLERSIEFAGSRSVPETLAYLEIATALVSPRTSGTSIPLKIYTYLEAGRPIVATEVAAHTQLLGPDCAVLVPADRKGFAEGIVRLLSDSLLQERLIRAGKQLCRERFQNDEYLNRLGAVYEGFSSQLDSIKSGFSERDSS